MKSSTDIRREFIEFFEQRQHTFVPSSSLLPADDPTLLFANAGMNQFKPIFLGTETRDYTRAVNTQKCIRAGGKHNDLEDVGRDCYHHTFFEMLGNWSFGDYFKAEAVQWAWELLTDVWGLPKDRLHVTVFEGDTDDNLSADDEAEALWRDKTDIDPTHIHKGNKKDNFWEMGETGPCGPCSEIHIDLTPDKSGAALVNAGDPRVIEIWNLVFMQFNRLASGTLEPLPATHVDTGMGFERICMVLQGKTSNYATDLWTPLIQQIEGFCSHQYGQSSGGADRFDASDETVLGDVAMRVICDHARTLTFAITDGILPGNEGRGSVLRAILRRAAGFGRQHLHIEGTFLHKLVPTIVGLMKDAFPELVDREAYVTEIIAGEEESFARTLDRGLAIFEKQVDKLRKNGETVIPGKVAFDLHTESGFPFSLTKLMAEKAGLAVDEDEYIRRMEEHRATSSAGGDTFKIDAVVGLPATDDAAKYAAGSVQASVLGWVSDGKLVEDGQLPEGAEAAVVLDQTNFYGESGGQAGDSGTLLADVGVFEVTDTKVAGQCVLHVGKVRHGQIKVGATVTATVCPKRMDIRRNHSATHLLNWALRETLGDGVNQAGSVVDADRLRFDFTSNAAMTPEQIRTVERLVNERVLDDEPITATLMPLEEAKELPGVRAVFGEKYPDPVRVIAMGPDRPEDATDATSIEFCGGTHLDRTSQVGLFKILAEESVAKGVRRITAVTGRGAAEWAAKVDAILSAASGPLKVPVEELPDRVVAMQKEIKKLRKRPAEGAAAGDLETIDTPAGRVAIGSVGLADAGMMRNLCDQQRQKGAVAVFVGAADEDEGKVVLIAMVSDELVKAGTLKAGDWVKAVAPVVGGGGGGKPNLAQAGGKQPEKLPDALVEAKRFVQEKLG